MDPFELRLVSLCRLLGLGVVAGCAVTPPDDPDRLATAADCTATELPEGWKIDVGWVEITAADPCPPASTHLEVIGNCCPAHVWKGATCEFVRRLDWPDGTVSTYGGTLTTDDTGASEPLECEYTAVFEIGMACCGRPLLEDGRMVVAPVRADSAWSAQRSEPTDLTPSERRRVAEHWLQAAQLEHASIGSFARFTLELLRFGAPPDLLAAAQQAALDEVRHAEICFSLASRVIGSRVGPAELPLDAAASLSLSRADFAQAVAREGCIGETVAALDAAARLAGATDHFARAALETIAEDESRHAALAWRTLRWLLSDDTDGTVRDRLRQVFATQPLPEPVQAEPTADERSHGLLNQAEQRRVFADGWQRVVLPAWVAMSADRSPHG